jgi:hypothetical protein
MKDSNYYAGDFKDIYKKETGKDWPDNGVLKIKGDINNPTHPMNPLIIIGSITDKVDEGLRFRGYTIKVVKGGYEWNEAKWFQDNDGNISSDD